MTSADHRRLDNVLRPIKEIAYVTQNWGYGFDIVAVNLTCHENKPRYIDVIMRIDGGPSLIKNVLPSSVSAPPSSHSARCPPPFPSFRLFQ